MSVRVQRGVEGPEMAERIADARSMGAPQQVGRRDDQGCHRRNGTCAGGINRTRIGKMKSGGETRTTNTQRCAHGIAICGPFVIQHHLTLPKGEIGVGNAHAIFRHPNDDAPGIGHRLLQGNRIHASSPARMRLE